jgi:1-deoxy-D-xylulose-5-phosphate reductoisomerase
MSLPGPETSLVLLGATGSIGTQTLDVVRHHPERFRLVGLAAGTQVERLAAQVQEFQPEAVCLATPAAMAEFRRLLPDYTGVCLVGESGLDTLATWPSAQKVVFGLVGMRGLRPTLAALQAGKTVLTANKETFVTGGHLVAPYLDQIVPFDSEHSAIFQCLKAEPGHAVRRILLTASGGPFRTTPVERLPDVTRAQALVHPNWVMGAKVTIDSATLMNKGLEVIEAHWLFSQPAERIEVVIHPQSIIHSAVEFIDGAVLAQLGVPDMRIPIQYAMTFPQRMPPCEPSRSFLELATAGSLTFESPDEARFPCLQLAYEALRLGSSACAVLNAADEVVVQEFLNDAISFIRIPTLLHDCLDAHRQSGAINPTPTLQEIQELDAWARVFVSKRMEHCRFPVSRQ